MATESTLNTLVPFKKGKQTLERDAGFIQGQMIAPAGTVTDAIVMEVECTISSTGAIGALTLAQRLSVLGLFSASLKQYAGENGAVIFESYQDVSLDKVRLDALRLLEQEVEGLDDATTGLARSYVLGNNQVVFRAYLPTGHIAKVRESVLFTGLSPEQLLDCEFTLKRGEGDPFTTANVGLALGTVKVTFSPGTKKAEARRIGIPPFTRRVVNAESDTITTPQGLVFDLSHEGPLLGTALGILTVKAGGITVTDDPSTPAKVYADFLRKYPSASDAEKTITSHRTPVYLAAPNALTRHFSGAVEAKQKDRTVEWAGRVLYLPLLKHEEILALVEAYAARIEPGRQLLAVNTALYEGMNLDDRLLPYAGITVLLDNEEGFADYPGLFCERNGRAYVHIPEHRQRQVVAKVAEAMRPGQRQFPSGNLRLVRSAVLDEVRWIPGAVTDPSGFRVMSKVRQDATTILRDAAHALRPELAAAF
ncbi:hypothetical protein [Myxococcus sp. RHSTA-1-4]|uniref:hypothetical protein n=1 Tax=Myxococcus sp. RHSTA-1-4 TaxID=2874601 RepID=UPI001CBFC524|nr:hypothetical protein [Myxococcus sp. RHSTA-1-4]MBZ4422020.1 hypothetical protein [Myxococcus sp. RHSTA-1-4]